MDRRKGGRKEGRVVVKVRKRKYSRVSKRKREKCSKHKSIDLKDVNRERGEKIKEHRRVTCAVE